MVEWTDITAAALNGDYDGYIRYANQVLNISGAATSSSSNGLRVFNIKENTRYQASMTNRRTALKRRCPSIRTVWQMIRMWSLSVYTLTVVSPALAPETVRNFSA